MNMHAKIGNVTIEVIPTGEDCCLLISKRVGDDVVKIERWFADEDSAIVGYAYACKWARKHEIAA